MQETIDVPTPLMERDCLQQHLGVWCLEPQSAAQLYHTIEQGDLETLVERAQAQERPELMEEVAYFGQTAIVPISGSLTKGKSSLGGTSTVEVRRVLDRLAKDDEVGSIVLHIDSPGGHVAGVPDLANDVSRLAQDGDAPTMVAFIEDMGASAAYWIASQAEHVFAANDVTKVGSIGVRTVVHDVSERMDERGIRVVSMATGERKDDFVRGQPIDDDAIAHHQAEIEAINEVFIETIAKARGLTFQQVDEFATGETFLAPRAVELGLIDGVRALRGILQDLQRPAMSSSQGGQSVPATVPQGEGRGSASALSASSLTGNIGSQRYMLLDVGHLDSTDAEPVEPDAEGSESLNNDLGPSTTQRNSAPRQGMGDDMPEDDNDDGGADVSEKLDKILSFAESNADRLDKQEERFEAFEDRLDQVEERGRASRREEVSDLLAGDEDPSEVQERLSELGFDDEQLSFLEDRLPDVQGASGLPNLQSIEDLVDQGTTPVEARMLLGDDSDLGWLTEEREVQDHVESQLASMGRAPGGS